MPEDREFSLEEGAPTKQLNVSMQRLKSEETLIRPSVSLSPRTALCPSYQAGPGYGCLITGRTPKGDPRTDPCCFSLPARSSYPPLRNDNYQHIGGHADERPRRETYISEEARSLVVVVRVHTWSDVCPVCGRMRKTGSLYPSYVPRGLESRAFAAPVIHASTWLGDVACACSCGACIRNRIIGREKGRLLVVYAGKVNSAEKNYGIPFILASPPEYSH